MWQSMSGRFIEQRLLVLAILLFSPKVMFWEKEIYSTNLWWESEVSGVLNLRENKLNKNDYFRSMSAKAVMLKIESSKCITTVHHWSSVNHSFELNFAWNLQIRILLDTFYETIKYFRLIRFDEIDCLIQFWNSIPWIMYIRYLRMTALLCGYLRIASATVSQSK